MNPSMQPMSKVIEERRLHTEKEKVLEFLNPKLEPTLGNGEEISDMVLEEVSLKARKIHLKKMCTLGNGNLIINSNISVYYDLTYSVAKVCSYLLKETSMKVIGKLVLRMAMVFSILDNAKPQAYTTGMMVADTKEDGELEILMDVEHGIMMNSSMLAIGKMV